MGVRGKFITFEGSEGSGKSTQARLLCRYLKARGKPFLHIREPGGTNISEQIRKILLSAKNKKMNAVCETLLYMAARAQLVEEIIIPALRQGKIVVCDRFLDSTIVYQGYGGGIDIRLIKKIGIFAAKNLKPDVTFLLDIPVRKGLARTGRHKDRIEQKSFSYHRRVRNGYLLIARREPQRIKLIKGIAGKSQIQSIIRRCMDKLI